MICEESALAYLTFVNFILSGAIAKENEGEYADLVYQIAQLNGNPGKAWGFTGISIFWIGSLKKRHAQRVNDQTV